MGKEMLSTCMLDLENECKHNLFVQNWLHRVDSFFNLGPLIDLILCDFMI